MGTLRALASKIAGLVTATARPAPSPDRRTWTSGGLTHVEVPGLRRPGSQDAAWVLSQRLTALPGVRSAEVNGVLGRVVVGHDPDVIGSEELTALVAEIEQELGLHLDEPPARVTHPGDMDSPQLREVAALGIDLVGLGYAALGRVLPVGALPPLVPALMGVVDTAPWLRAKLEAALGRQATETLLTIGGAAGNALSQRPVVLLTDIAYRLCLRREATARRQAWQRWEASVADLPEAYRAEPVDEVPRPRAVPDGPVEFVANTSAALALAGYAAGRIVVRNPGRAVGVLIAGVARAAKVGREAFAAQLDVDLSEARALIFDPDALRRLDRVDTVVVDASVLLTGRHIVDEVVAVDDAEGHAELFAHALDLVDVHAPRAPRRDDGWAVAPVSELDASLPGHARQVAREKAHAGATVLVLTREARPVGVVSVVAETDPLTDALIAAARRAGTLVLGGVTDGLDQRLDVDRVVPGGNRLATSVRALQAEGHVVAVVSTRGRSALAAADLGIGVPGPTGAVPWAADVLCVGLAQACVVLDAATAARKASRHSAELAVAGSSLGVLLGVFGPVRGAPARAAYPVQLAALLALAAGTWWGSQPRRRPAPVPVDRTPWHAMSPQAVLSALTSSSRGLDAAESERRRRHEPVDDDPSRFGLARASVEELANPLTPALAAGAGLSASLGSITDAVMISGVLGLNALIGGAQRVGANRELRRLLDTSALRARLRRKGEAQDVRADQLVVGDVIEYHAGDAVPADCRLLEADRLEVDESSLTGESQLVAKTVRATGAAAVADRSSMLYQGTVVAAGRAVGVVVATGGRTEAGRTTRLADGDAPITGVASRLRSLTKQALPVSLGAGALLMVMDLLRGHGMSQALGRAVGLAVASVPEALPFVATVAELASARRLSRHGVLARSPSTIEALGRVDVLCFDKTGTLTEGRITVQQIGDGRTERPVSDLTPSLREVLAAATRASPWHETARPPAHPTDGAVLDVGRRLSLVPDDWDHVASLPFEPSRGYHAMLARSPRGLVVSVKGAPEAVLAACSRWRGEPFDAQARHDVEASVDRLARKGFRVLAVAEREDSGSSELTESSVGDLDFRGLVALADPVRSTAAESVDRLRRAGVDVVMITGDHPSTAEAIAAELNVLNGGRVMTGPELDALDDDALAAVVPEITVFARVSPEQKARIVRRLQHAKRVVAMTGDGANDAPAIRLADVGIALGSRATPAAREAADLVVTDDRIETITDAIVEGRGTWSSVRAALSILLGGNLGEIAFTLAAGLLSARDTLNARQLLLINLLTDVLPALAVAVRPPPHSTPEQLLAEGPDASLGVSLTRDIYVRAATTAGAAMLAWLLARPVSTSGQAGTTALVALVSAQLGQTVAVRGRTPLVVAAGVGSLVALAAFVQVPGVSRFFGNRPLLPHQWFIALTAAAAATAVQAFSRHGDFRPDSPGGHL
ncbi:cation-transporting ATPase [Saccharothrix sp. ALI-22-I]|uniref:cation-translocating P-type ATPase n=1 Tax=Saccharothrix sp. ALI-22-I TaxID=1933778 RepID=UPI00097C78FC|nr:cation-translocating P-type ATPase [Saccharothrix sp. ALI-22-I]ONI82627.1 cation-transporting ATPase [Saccharothrix sp. ALI-22-I]